MRGATPPAATYGHAAPFQSTLPVRGATSLPPAATVPGRDFNPRSPCGERQVFHRFFCAFYTISIHAPRAGSDRHCPSRNAVNLSFQSTLPVRGATTAEHPAPLSIDDFNPRSPCGERQSAQKSRAEIVQFQSTLPVRGATNERFISCRRHRNFNPRSPCGERLTTWLLTMRLKSISIHAPRAGSDSMQRVAILPTTDFNPRSPCGERRNTGCGCGNI